jgi:thiamine-phosphate pyrophosphorylase
VPPLPRLIAISDRRSLPGGDLARWAGELAAAGVEGLQLREKDLDDQDLFELAVVLRRAFPPPGRLLVNGRLDVALAAAADGVHLPASGLPVAALRRRFGGEALIGRSAHRPEEVEAAAREGADYVTFGPVYPTPAKAVFGPPAGLGGLARAARAGIPVFALGGVSLPRLPEIAQAGAAGAAGIGMFREPADLAGLTAEAHRLFPAPPPPPASTP